jgi:hypothetical protein
MILLRKCRDAKMVQDFRSISLIQSFGKLVTKVLAMQLAPFMDSLVMPNQSAFINGRALHDNFRTVHLTAKLLHARRLSSALLKIDIAKAFDTIGWPFLLELHHHLDFSGHWYDWISFLLSTASTRILLNSRPGRHICHSWGLWQGDPLSPFLFVLTMEVLNALFLLADTRHLLTPFQTRVICYRVFLMRWDRRWSPDS